MIAPTAGAHGRRILEARDEAKLTASRGDIRAYLFNGGNPFDCGTEPAAMAELIMGEVGGLASLFALGFDDAVKAQEHHPLGSSEVMQCSPRDHARAMEGIARLAALAGFYAPEAQG